MLIIRSAQMDALSRHARKVYEERLSRYLAQSFPEQCARLPPAPEGEPVRAFVRAVIDRAATYRIDVERDVTRYAELVLLHGERFEETPGLEWSRPLLHHATLPGSAKMELIDLWLTSGQGATP